MSSQALSFFRSVNKLNLHEYQAKNIFREFGIPVPHGLLVNEPGRAFQAARSIKGPPWVVKAQVHAGARGKAGGVKIVNDLDVVEQAAQSMIGQRIITNQTGPAGVMVNQVLVEEGVEIEREFYLSMAINRRNARPTMIFSPVGGVEIEEVMLEYPDLILIERPDPVTGWMPFQARNLLYRLDPLPSPEAIDNITFIAAQVFEIFLKYDCSLIEINPLVITREGKVIALDVKISIDDNASFRQEKIFQLDDKAGKDPLELQAEEYGINYIHLDGNVGVLVNGAGLAMATMDIIKQTGARPANFLDVGGGANEETISRGFEIILKDRHVKAILINIFGGILRCDELAKGVLAALKRMEIHVPLVIRLQGTRVEEGREILKNSDLKFLVAKDLAEAARLVAEQVS